MSTILHYFGLLLMNVTLQLVIEARIGQPGYSDIAIDDVYLDPGLCSKYHTVDFAL